VPALFGKDAARVAPAVVFVTSRPVSRRPHFQSCGGEPPALGAMRLTDWRKRRVSGRKACLDPAARLQCPGAIITNTAAAPRVAARVAKRSSPTRCGENSATAAENKLRNLR